jgi:hypothetical protein
MVEAEAEGGGEDGRAGDEERGKETSAVRGREETAVMGREGERPAAVSPDEHRGS